MSSARAEPRPRAASRTAAPAPVAVASFPEPIPENRYQELLYEELARHGIVLVRGARFDLGWLARNRGRVALLHFHWPEPYYRHRRARTRASRALSWPKTALFALRLAAARLLGYRVVWTVHQVRPHDHPGRLDDVAVRALARSCRVLLVHDRPTAEAARRLPRRGSRAVLVVPHGSYAGAYPPGRPRAEVRAALGIDAETTAFLCFGNVRAYKGIELLLEAFAGARLGPAALVVAGAPLDREVAARVAEAARRDPRIVARLEFVPDEEVEELYRACDVAVVPRSDGGTSGAIVLALSHALPVVAARLPAYAELLRDGAAGWLFEPGDPLSLREALEAAAGDPEAARARRAAAQACADDLAWPAIGRRIAAAMREALA